jgi:hypothetical protein
MYLLAKIGLGRNLKKIWNKDFFVENNFWGIFFWGVSLAPPV